MAKGCAGERGACGGEGCGGDGRRRTHHVTAEHERDHRLTDEEAFEPALEHCALLPEEVALDLVQSRLQLSTHLGICAAGQLRLLDDLLALKVDHLRRVEQVLQLDAHQLAHLSLHSLHKLRLHVALCIVS